jgi:hypothetical protein
MLEPMHLGIRGMLFYFRGQILHNVGLVEAIN